MAPELTHGNALRVTGSLGVLSMHSELADKAENSTRREPDLAAAQLKVEVEVNTEVQPADPIALVNAHVLHRRTRHVAGCIHRFD